MKIHYSFESINDIRNPVVTTGTFDGVHVGHQVIISRLNRLARDVNGESVLITFHPHPRRVLYPDGKGKDLLLICSQEEKKNLLEDTGLDHLVIIEFTKEFAKTTSKDFVEKILVGKLKSRVVVVGFNHHFGFNREGDFSYLYKLGRKSNFEVEEIPEQDIHNESVSSTKIRKALLDGNIQRANAYLDHYYLLQGEVYNHSQNTQLLGYPVYRVKVSEDVKLIPPDGVYAVNIESNGQLAKGLVSVKNWGIYNNLMSPDVEVEFCFLDNERNSEPEEVMIYFHKSLRKGIDSDRKNDIRERLRKDLRAIDELIY